MIAPILFGTFDIFSLRALLASAEQEDNRHSNLPEVDPIAWAIIHSKLLDTLSDTVTISKVSESDPVQPYSNLRAGSCITQGSEPFTEGSPAILRDVNSELPGTYLHVPSVA